MTTPPDDLVNTQRMLEALHRVLINDRRREKQIVYDLKPDWTFCREDIGGVLRLDQLETAAQREPGKITGQAILGDPLRTQPVRVLVNLSSDGLALWEVGRRVSHRWAHKAPYR